MLLGFNTNGLQNHRLDDALRLMADRGYQAVALTLDVQHLDPYRATPREVETIAALLEQLGLHPVIETGARFLLDPTDKHEPTLMTRGEDARAARLDFYARAARIGRDLGAQVVSFWSGVDRVPAEDSAEILRSGVLSACELISGVGLRPAMEPEPGMSVETVQDFLGLRRDLALEELALTLDIGHLYATREGSPEEIIPTVSQLLVQVHLEDMRRGVHEHLVPGEGHVDFHEVRRALEAARYAGPVCFELSRSSHRAHEVLGICQQVWEAARS